MDHSHEWVAITPTSVFPFRGRQVTIFEFGGKTNGLKRTKGALVRERKAPLVTFDVLPIAFTEGTCCRVGTFPQVIHTQVGCSRGLQASFEFCLC